MCTVTMLPVSYGIDVFFNRDESRQRKSELAPQHVVVDGVSAIMPVDGNHGGTWLGVNEYGVVIGILNAYVTYPVTGHGGRRSRGLLVKDLLAETSLDSLTARMSTISLSMYDLFTLLAVDRHGKAIVFRHQGTVIDIEDAPCFPLSSSGFDTERAIQTRVDTYRRQLADAGGMLSASLLSAYHRSHDPEKGPYSVCMHRDDAQTQSMTHIHLGRNVATVAYVSGPPCEARAPVSESLSLIRN